jgi:acetoin utilization protein AcuB
MIASKKKPGTTIRAYMTPAPHTVGFEQTLEEAHQIMRTHRIRHLPVLHGGKLVGVVSQRDLALIESLPGVEAKEVPIEDAMTTDVYVVSPRAPIRVVASEMADRKLGSAVVVDGERVVGMFTVTDACRALARLVPGRAVRRA